MKFKLEVEATDEEIKTFAVDVLHRTAGKFLGQGIRAYSDAVDDLIDSAGRSGLLDKLGAMVANGFSGPRGDPVSRVAHMENPPRDCGSPGPADTVEGSMWKPCQSPVEFVVEVPKFGNRGHVQRVCCAKHKDYVVGGAADAKVTRIAPPPDVPPPPPTEH